MCAEDIGDAATWKGWCGMRKLSRASKDADTVPAIRLLGRLGKAASGATYIGLQGMKYP
jgi:hypothetical protein